MSGEYKIFEEKMSKSIEAVSQQFATVRAGRANAGVLEHITVEYYGANTPITQIASVSVPEPTMLVIQPWDASALKSIEKAILTSDLGINPTNDGRVIRLSFPRLTEERRRELIKLVAKYAEDGKVAVRNIRRDALDMYKKQLKKSEITEDDYKVIETDIQALTDKFCKEIDNLYAKKEKELLEV